MLNVLCCTSNDNDTDGVCYRNVRSLWAYNLVSNVKYVHIYVDCAIFPVLCRLYCLSRFRMTFSYYQFLSFIHTNLNSSTRIRISKEISWKMKRKTVYTCFLNKKRNIHFPFHFRWEHTKFRWLDKILYKRKWSESNGIPLIECVHWREQERNRQIEKERFLLFFCKFVRFQN